ncbi:hypothetical protein SELR_25390 [Selenomonas ruminantium subsp. lactilytica TAM6421]|uniref:Uncharacterized protein n=1 Tax=Selenomonas ruminantium subsp. lactilytica (strain NBRC 103574 / TAM6421) TaxID=927704 RepID=I0GU10_SELRL|nr:hypothetical protein [Selenomonas ruminantium]BAL84247.1 hypothetical protein SELR_25390 [Selenomonas ruminantium subsp. lactilytica TAM6421]
MSEKKELTVEERFCDMMNAADHMTKIEKELESYGDPRIMKLLELHSEYLMMFAMDRAIISWVHKVPDVDKAFNDYMKALQECEEASRED